MNNGINTHFAPPERISKKKLESVSDLVNNDPIIKVVLESLNGYVLVLNDKRQILAANEEVLDLLQKESPSSLVGMRAGEALKCIHFRDGPGGCGTSKACKTCGAVIATMASLEKDIPVKGECSIVVENETKKISIDFKVKSTPIKISGQKLLVFVLQDISSQKRRETLESIFFHDIQNILLSLMGWSEMLKMDDPQNAAEQILRLSERLSSDINEQKSLMLAEAGELSVDKQKLNVLDVLSTLKSVFMVNKLSEEKNLKIVEPDVNFEFVSDFNLLMRVLSNMVKNAFEAIDKGESVTVWVEKESDKSTFYVNNKGTIREDIALRIFERSVTSKKEKGSGLGTYIMKLFGEQYLGGEVKFNTNQAKGITFSISLPDIEVC